MSPIREVEKMWAMNPTHDVDKYEANPLGVRNLNKKPNPHGGLIFNNIWSFELIVNPIEYQWDYSMW